MFRIIPAIAALFAVTAVSMPHAALAQTPDEILAAISQDARSANPAFRGFSAANGERFFQQTHSNELSCASCHTDNPAAVGKHARTGKSIRPLAPAANAERLTDTAKVDKWFKRNCNDVLERACTAQEKGDVLTYLLAIKH